MYTKDITFLLRLLHTSKQSGILFVEAPGQDELPWQGEFQLRQGMVLSCLVRNKADGRVLLSNNEALHWLTRQGKLSWRVEEDAQSPAPSPHPPPPDEQERGEKRVAGDAPPPAPWRNQYRAVPQRTQKGKVVPVNVFASRDHRQVLTLVDGQRTVEEIVQLLHKPPDAVIRILQELQASGFIL